MSTTSITTAFPPGLINEVFALLSSEVRINMILSWARKFADPDYESDLGIVEIIKSITLLDLSLYLGIKEESFCNLVHLPFSSSLTHLDLSRTSLGESPKLVEILGHPIFQHLVTLDLHDAQLTNINPLFNAPHQFPNLHTINLARNFDLEVPQIATTTQFPNLKVLDISEINLYNTTMQGFSAPPATTTAPTTTAITESTTIVPPSPSPPPFQLETLSIGGAKSSLDANLIPMLSRSPHLAQLKEFNITSVTIAQSAISGPFIDELFDPATSVLKNLTVLDFGNLPLDFSALAALGQCPLLSNLTTLRFGCFLSSATDPIENATNQQSIQTFINSPYLWGPQLKHLSLQGMSHCYPEFAFDHLIPTLDAANIQLETLELSDTTFSLAALSSAPCLTSLKQFLVEEWSEMSPALDQDEPGRFDLFIQSPILSNLETLAFDRQFRLGLTSAQWVSLLSSPMFSNNLIQLDFSHCTFPMGDVIKTLCTQRVIAGDETSPLKYGKLQKLDLSSTQITADDIGLVVENLTQLTSLSVHRAHVGKDKKAANDETLAALLSTEIANPYYPYPSLPNLVKLDVSSCDLSSEFFIQLSKSQLLDQLERLDVSGCLGLFDWDQDITPGLHALLTTPNVSNLKELVVYLPPKPEFDNLKKDDCAIMSHLDNCTVSHYQ